jgi:hypothetical protein
LFWLIHAKAHASAGLMCAEIYNPEFGLFTFLRQNHFPYKRNKLYPLPSSINMSVAVGANIGDLVRLCQNCPFAISGCGNPAAFSAIDVSIVVVMLV